MNFNAYSHEVNTKHESFPSPKDGVGDPSHVFIVSAPSPQAPSDLFSVDIVLPFLELYVN